MAKQNLTSCGHCAGNFTSHEHLERYAEYS